MARGGFVDAVIEKVSQVIESLIRRLVAIPYGFAPIRFSLTDLRGRTACELATVVDCERLNPFLSPLPERFNPVKLNYEFGYVRNY